MEEDAWHMRPYRLRPFDCDININEAWSEHLCALDTEDMYVPAPLSEDAILDQLADALARLPLIMLKKGNRVSRTDRCVLRYSDSPSPGIEEAFAEHVDAPCDNDAVVPSPLRTLRMPGLHGSRRKTAHPVVAYVEGPHSEKERVIVATFAASPPRCGCPSQFRRPTTAVSAHEPTIVHPLRPDKNFMKSRGRGHSKRQPEELGILKKLRQLNELNLDL